GHLSVTIRRPFSRSRGKNVVAIHINPCWATRNQPRRKVVGERNKILHFVIPHDELVATLHRRELRTITWSRWLDARHFKCRSGRFRMSNDDGQANGDGECRELYRHIGSFSV